MTEFIYNNFIHAFAGTSPFYLIYKYNSEIHYKVKNSFIKEEKLSAKEYIKQFHNIRNQLIQRLQKTSVQQTKYYNINHQSKSYSVSDLILLSIKSFKQKRSNKKLSSKFINSFRMKNKIGVQKYHLTLSNIYRIHNIFYVSFLKSYLHRVNS